MRVVLVATLSSCVYRLGGVRRHQNFSARKKAYLRLPLADEYPFTDTSANCGSKRCQCCCSTLSLQSTCLVLEPPQNAKKRSTPGNTPSSRLSLLGHIDSVSASTQPRNAAWPKGRALCSYCTTTLHAHPTWYLTSCIPLISAARNWPPTRARRQPLKA